MQTSAFAIELFCEPRPMLFVLVILTVRNYTAVRRSFSSISAGLKYIISALSTLPSSASSG
jgi:hypothetical protein